MFGRNRGAAARVENLANEIAARRQTVQGALAEIVREGEGYDTPGARLHRVFASFQADLPDPRYLPQSPIR